MGISLLITTGCGRELIVRDIEQHETVINKYREPRGNDGTILISRWGSLIRKWRVTDDASALLYQVDTTTQICRAGVQIVPCSNIKLDADMAPYIDW